MVQITEDEFIRYNELLKRNIPLEKEYDDRGWPRCPACKKMIGDGMYCRYCGQALKERI